MPRRRAIVAVAAVALAALAAAGVPLVMLGVRAAGHARRTRAVLAGMSSATAPAPSGPHLVAQRFGFADGTSAFFGRGFFTRGRTGNVVGVTALHMLELRGPALVSVEWFLDESSLAPVGAATRTFSRPGRQPDAMFERLRDDYLLLTPDEPPRGVEPMELDDRAAGPDVAEPVWFPLPDARAPGGVRWIPGAVDASGHDALEVLLGEEGVALRGTSGSPVVSGRTGRVVGLVSGERVARGLTRVLVAPIGGVRRALIENDAAASKRLADVDWLRRRADAAD